MKEERLKILEMVENGKISADDAVKLLDAVGAKKVQFDSNEFADKIDDKVKKAVKALDEFGKEINTKISDVSQDVQPKIEGMVRVVIEKASETIDECTKLFKSENDGCCCGTANEDEQSNCCSNDSAYDDTDTPKEN